MNDEEKIVEGIAGLKAFFDALGPNDIYKQILLEVLFENLYGVEDGVHLLDEEG